MVRRTAAICLLLAFLATACSGSATSNNNRAVELLDQGKWAEAIAELDKAIEIEPDNAIAYANRGLAYRFLGPREKAIADYDKAIEVSPRTPGNQPDRSCPHLPRPGAHLLRDGSV